MLSCYNFNLPQQFCALKKDGSNNGDLWSIEIFTPKYSTYRNIRVGDPPALIIERYDNQLVKQTALKMALNILIIATVKVFLAN